jgi:hypothetical protein
MKSVIASMVDVVTAAKNPPRKRSYKGRSIETNEVILFCRAPRSAIEVKRHFEDRVSKRLVGLVKDGLLVNLTPGEAFGLYVDARHVPMQIERICWYSPDAEMPDDETTVMLSVEGQDEVHDGYHDCDTWYWAANGAPVTGRVVAWAHKPVGPAQPQSEVA